jgi:hypothetical protein
LVWTEKGREFVIGLIKWEMRSPKRLND